MAAPLAARLRDKLHKRPQITFPKVLKNDALRYTGQCVVIRFHEPGDQEQVVASTHVTMPPVIREVLHFPIHNNRSHIVDRPRSNAPAVMLPPLLV
eukprot:211996-Rhodomonas_salina.2